MIDGLTTGPKPGAAV